MAGISALQRLLDNQLTFNPADPNIYKGVIPAVGAGGMLALMDAEEAKAAWQPWQKGMEYISKLWGDE